MIELKQFLFNPLALRHILIGTPTSNRTSGLVTLDPIMHQNIPHRAGIPLQPTILQHMHPTAVGCGKRFGNGLLNKRNIMRMNKIS